MLDGQIGQRRRRRTSSRRVLADAQVALVLRVEQVAHALLVCTVSQVGEVGRTDLEEGDLDRVRERVGLRLGDAIEEGAADERDQAAIRAVAHHRVCELRSSPALPTHSSCRIQFGRTRTSSH